MLLPVKQPLRPMGAFGEGEVWSQNILRIRSSFEILEVVGVR